MMNDSAGSEGAEGARGEGIRRSWDANARGWTSAVRGELIASRKLVTNRAMVDAVMALSPARVLDVGCGEGWLARELAARGVEVRAIDGSADLISTAAAAGGAAFEVCSYEDLIADPARAGDGYDVAACNFSLLDSAVAAVLSALGARLRDGGAIVIQTVHPWASRGDEGYVDGWRTETFSGFSNTAEFREPMPWYFRTLESWGAEIRRAGFVIAELREPRHPETGEPVSLLLRAVREGPRAS